MKILFLLFALLLCTAGCGPLQQALPPVTDGTVRIGVILPLSGKNRVYGERLRNGIQLAAKELNYSRGIGGLPVELVICDNRSDPAESLRLAHSLAASGIRGLIPGYDSREVVVLKDFIAQNAIPAITPVATDDTLGEVPTFFQTVFTNQEQAKVLAGYAWYWRNLRRIGILIDTAPGADYSRDIARSCGRFFTGLGGAVVKSVEFQNDMKDFTQPLQQLLEAGPQAILIPAETESAAKIVKQLRALGFRGLLLGTDSWDEREFLAACGSNPGECAFTAFYSAEFDQEENRLFQEAFRREFFIPASTCEAQGYDAMKLMAVGLEGAETPQDFISNLKLLRNHPGAAAHYSYRETTHFDRTVFIMTLRAARDGEKFPSSRLSRSFPVSMIDKLQIKSE